MPTLRFDDLRSTPPRSFGFDRPARVLVARRLDEVIDLVREVVAASNAGSWAAGFLAYEAAPAFDPSLAVRSAAPQDPFAEVPLAWFAIYDSPTPMPPLRPGSASFGAYRWEPSVPRAAYERQVDEIREYIRDGDAYQVNHTIRLRGRAAGSATAFYTSIALAQGGGQSAYLDIGRYRVLSASPELFFSINDTGILTTRPMKGTAARGRTPQEDRAAADLLRATLKERAENAMIVDLLRNDMGRVSVPGSVEVTDLYAVERYETVWQMTSTIESTLLPDAGLEQVFTALFPSGSVTGAPKVRSMEIIAELETHPRGVYCGAIGWVAPRGHPGDRAAFSVAIRTVVLDTHTDTVEYGVGGGITYDSDPAAEYRECVAKSRVLTTRRPAFELLETFPYTDGTIPLLQAHLDRMAASADYFGFTFDQAAALKAIDGARIDPCVMRLTMRRGGVAGVTTRPFPPVSDAPVRLAIDDELVDPDDIFLFHKTTLRLPYERRSARHPDADQVVLCNSRGHVTETTIANIAIERDGQWITPPVDDGLLPGIERERLLANGTITEGSITRRDFEAASSIAVFNSVRGWLPATLVAKD